VRCSRFSLATGLAILALTPASARAADGVVFHRHRVGLGATLGDPTGAHVKLFVHPRHALSSSVGFAPLHLGAGRVDLSWLFHSKPWGRSTELDTHGYFGLGVGLAFWSDHFGYLGVFGPTPGDLRKIAFFFRAPVLGLAFHFEKMPFGLFLETAYTPLVGPPIAFWTVDFVLGGHFWF
jgi:hypothetical protein